MVAGIVLMGWDKDCPTLPKWVRMRLLDRMALGIRKVLVLIFDKVEKDSRTGGIGSILVAGITTPFLYLFGWPFMLWIQWRDLWNMIEDDIRPTTYSYLPRSEAVDWKSEGF